MAKLKWSHDLEDWMMAAIGIFVMVIAVGAAFLIERVEYRKVIEHAEEVVDTATEVATEVAEDVVQ